MVSIIYLYYQGREPMLEQNNEEGEGERTSAVKDETDGWVCARSRSS